MSKKKVDEKDSTTESTETAEKETGVKTYNVPYFDKNGEELKQLEVDASLFMGKSKKELYTTLHQMIVGYTRAKRVGTHSAKTKGEVAGSGKKPWRQKGTGRARVGTRRAPHWRGGGMTHAIKPRDYRVAMPKSMRHAAMNFAFLTKLRDTEILVIEGFDFEDDDKPKTRTISTVINKIMPKKDKTCYLGIDVYDKRMLLSTRNIQNIKLDEIRNFNAYDLIRNKYIVLTKQAFDSIVKTRKSEKEDAK
ncbi:MAG: 50S ribosomal protein L4 [Planctomycetes bacterium]|nr:50S ribosomal protein L4 [Planctomycetota bacterium]